MLLVSPAVLLVLLLGVDQPSPEEIVVTRIAGAALLAFGVACWPGRNGKHRPAPPALLPAVLIYDVVVGVLLAYAGVFLRMSGLALWPAVVLHSALAVWCVLCLARPVGHAT